MYSSTNIPAKVPIIIPDFFEFGLPFTACLQITREYYKSGYWAILQTPKHILNAVVLHVVARALRWHIDRMLGVNFAAGDEVSRFPPVYRAVLCTAVETPLDDPQYFTAILLIVFVAVKAWA